MWFSWFDNDKDGNVNAADLERARYVLTYKRNDDGNEFLIFDSCYNMKYNFDMTNLVITLQKYRLR
jgi:hypothetical protein